MSEREREGGVRGLGKKWWRNEAKKGEGPVVLTGKEADDVGTPLVKENVLVKKPANGALALRNGHRWGWQVG